MCFLCVYTGLVIIDVYLFPAGRKRHVQSRIYPYAPSCMFSASLIRIQRVHNGSNKWKMQCTKKIKPECQKRVRWRGCTVFYTGLKSAEIFWCEFLQRVSSVCFYFLMSLICCFFFWTVFVAWRNRTSERSDTSFQFRRKQGCYIILSCHSSYSRHG